MIIARKKMLLLSYDGVKRIDLGFNSKYIVFFNPKKSREKTTKR
jgi:hypothetical protein